jgi:integrase
MLRLIKKHVAGCAKTSEKDWKCKPKDGTGKVACPFYIVGPDPTNPTGPRIKIHTHTSAEQTARAVLIDFERSLFDPSPQPTVEPKRTMAEVIDLYLNTKKHNSEDRQRRLKQQLSGMAQYLTATFGHHHITDVNKTDLEQFMFSWDGAYSTLKTRRENLKGFWKYSYDSDFTPKNIAATLPTIGDQRQQKEQRVPTLTLDEIEQIFGALHDCASLYVREGENIAKQIRAFTMIERYTGMAVGDVAKLRKDEVVGNQIVVNRTKTNEPVWTAVPLFVIDALNTMTPDSQEYFFWSGTGKLHTRTSKWGKRLQKLFVFAGVRVREEVKTRRSGGKLKGKPETVKVSSVTPHYWRHTFVRDHYLIDTPVEEIAELIGDDSETVRTYYSCFDHLRQKKLLKRQEAFWKADKMAQKMVNGNKLEAIPIQ